MRRGATNAASRRCAGALFLIACATLSACDDESEPAEPTASPTEERQTTQADADAPADENEPPPEETQDTTTTATPAPPPRDPDEQAVARTVRTYLLGLDAGDGARVCSALAPEALNAVELPEDRGDCASSLTASIGYRDPRGLPVFEGLKLAGIRSIEIEGEAARARATTVTTFADREEPSIEDDLVYLTKSGADWLIAKPSAAFFRAIGAADVPPSVIAPPAG